MSPILIVMSTFTNKIKNINPSSIERGQNQKNYLPASARHISPKGTLVQTPRRNLCSAAFADAILKPLQE